MTPKTNRQRWNTMVEKAADDKTNGPFLFPSQVVTLIAREHQRTVRMVQEMRKAEVEGLNIRQYLEACNDLLARLKGRP